MPDPIFNSTRFAGDDQKFRGIRVTWFRRGFGCFRQRCIIGFCRIEIFNESDIVVVTLGKLNAHAVFHRNHRCLDRTPYYALQLGLRAVREMNDDINLGAGREGPVSPDEKTRAGEVARNCPVKLAVCYEFGLEPADEPLVSSSRSQKGSSIKISSSLFCPVETIIAFTPMSDSMRLRYACALLGRLLKFLMPSVLSFHPFISS